MDRTAPPGKCKSPCLQASVGNAGHSNCGKYLIVARWLTLFFTSVFMAMA
jgi:hypothetical protein